MTTFLAIWESQEWMETKTKHKTSQECHQTVGTHTRKQITKAIHPKARAIQITMKAIDQKTRTI